MDSRASVQGHVVCASYFMNPLWRMAKLPCPSSLSGQAVIGIYTSGTVRRSISFPLSVLLGFSIPAISSPVSLEAKPGARSKDIYLLFSFLWFSEPANFCQ